MTNPLSGVESWLYHLGDVDAVRASQIAATGADLIVIDRTDYSGTPRDYGPADLAAMRGEGALIVSYLSIGEAETYRDYWDDAWLTAPPDWIDTVNPNFTDNIKVKYWDAEWQDIILSTVDSIVDQGFDGLYLDLVAAFFHFEETAPGAGTDYRAEMAAFVGAVRDRATARLEALGDDRPFAILGQNGVELIETPGYLAAIDGIGQEDLRFLYDDPAREAQDFERLPDDDYNYVLEYLALAEQMGREVFVVEYMTTARQAEFATDLAAELADLTALDIPLFLAESRDLDTLSDQSAISGPRIGAGLSAESAREVAYLFEAALDRDGAIRTEGLNFWIDQREAGLSREALARTFLASDEFAAAFGEADRLSDADLVRVLFRNVLDREGAPQGISFWMRWLENPQTDRAGLLLEFAGSAENVAGSPEIADLLEIAPGTWDFV